jgi:hypothetical protein
MNLLLFNDIISGIGVRIVADMVYSVRLLCEDCNYMPHYYRRTSNRLKVFVTGKNLYGHIVFHYHIL